eukprot:366130-Chlamydomonas_euryale.AAC.29
MPEREPSLTCTNNPVMQDCVFADPFVSFSGTDRFKQNVGNLGGLMYVTRALQPAFTRDVASKMPCDRRDINLDVYDWKEEGDAVNTKWRFSCILDLPWRPRLAAAACTLVTAVPQTIAKLASMCWSNKQEDAMSQEAQLT